MNAHAGWYRGCVRREKREVALGLLLGLVASLLLHFYGVVEASRFLGALGSERVTPEPEAVRITLELPEERYAEANPEIPENTPEETPLIAARDQQAAQPETLTLMESDVIPDAGGEIPNPKVVDGDPRPPQPLAPGTYTTEAIAQEAVEAPEGEGSPEALPSTEALQAKQAPKSPEFLTEPETANPASTPVLIAAGKDEAGEESESVDRIDLSPLRNPEADAPGAPEVAGGPAGKPLPRPKLSPQVWEGSVMRSETTARRIGTIAIESRLSDFGAYQQRLMEAISAEWNQLAYEVGIPVSDRPSRVLMRFSIDRFGEVSGVEVVETSAGPLSTQLPGDAIRARAPYGEWTSDMIASLGRSTDLEIGFRYR